MSFISQTYRSSMARLWILAGVMLVGMMSAKMPAQDAPPVYDLKAAFLYHFGQFVEWPATSFASPGAPLVIGLYGIDPFHGDLERIVAGQNINGHPVVVRQGLKLSDLRSCNIVFINSSEQPHQAGILGALNGAAVLTVTEDMDQFSHSGFMINLLVEDDKIRFEINEEAALRAGLRISPKLLSLARP